MRKVDQQQSKIRARLRKTRKRNAGAHKSGRNEGERAAIERQNARGAKHGRVIAAAQLGKEIGRELEAEKHV